MSRKYLQSEPLKLVNITKRFFNNSGSARTKSTPCVQAALSRTCSTWKKQNTHGVHRRDKPMKKRQPGQPSEPGSVSEGGHVQTLDARDEPIQDQIDRRMVFVV